MTILFCREDCSTVGPYYPFLFLTFPLPWTCLSGNLIVFLGLSFRPSRPIFFTPSFSSCPVSGPSIALGRVPRVGGSFSLLWSPGVQDVGLEWVLNGPQPQKVHPINSRSQVSCGSAERNGVSFFSRTTITGPPTSPKCF